MERTGEVMQMTVAERIDWLRKPENRKACPIQYLHTDLESMSVPNAKELLTETFGSRFSHEQTPEKLTLIHLNSLNTATFEGNKLSIHLFDRQQILDRLADGGYEIDSFAEFSNIQLIQIPQKRG